MTAREASTGTDARCGGRATAPARAATGVSHTTWDELHAQGLTAAQAADVRNAGRNSALRWARRVGKTWPTSHDQTRDEWLALAAEGLTAKQAAKRRGVGYNTAQAAARAYGFTWAPTQPEPQPEPKATLPQVRKPKPRDPLRGGVVLSLRGGAATYGMQIASALQSAPAGTRLIYCRARADECGPAKAAAAKVAADTGATMTQWPIGTGEGRLWAYAIVRAAA